MQKSIWQLTNSSSYKTSYYQTNIWPKGMGWDRGRGL